MISLVKSEFTKNPEKEEIDRLESILENFKKKTSGGDIKSGP